MKICGLQKLSLLDFPGNLAATVFTAGCNLRCKFCHNAALVTGTHTPEEIPNDYFFDFLNKRRGLIDGICLTGGEPLLQPDTEDFLRAVKELGFKVKLDTNGCFPERLDNLLKKGLVDYAAMDVKNSPLKYSETCGVAFDVTEQVKHSADILAASGIDYELRTTVADELHSVVDILLLAKWIGGAKKYFIQNFRISDDIIGDGMSPCSLEKLEKMKEAARPYFETVQLRGIDE